MAAHEFASSIILLFFIMAARGADLQPSSSDDEAVNWVSAPEVGATWGQRQGPFGSLTCNGVISFGFTNRGRTTLTHGVPFGVQCYLPDGVVIAPGAESQWGHSPGSGPATLDYSLVPNGVFYGNDLSSSPKRVSGIEECEAACSSSHDHCVGYGFNAESGYCALKRLQANFSRFPGQPFVAGIRIPLQLSNVGFHLAPGATADAYFGLVIQAPPQKRSAAAGSIRAGGAGASSRRLLRGDGAGGGAGMIADGPSGGASCPPNIVGPDRPLPFCVYYGPGVVTGRVPPEGEERGRGQRRRRWGGSSKVIEQLEGKIDRMEAAKAAGGVGGGGDSSYAYGG